MKKGRGQNFRPKVAIACGGTGGHFFPGVAIADALRRQGCDVLLLASQKQIDRDMAQGLSGYDLRFLPAVGLVRGQRLRFGWALCLALRHCLQWFVSWRPDAVVVMGGFTSVAPGLMGRLLGARVFLHEANSVPGRANRFLARFCHRLFVGFAEAEAGFGGRTVTLTGTPVRAGFGGDAEAEDFARFNLRRGDPVLLIMGGSQGARALNQAMLELAPRLVALHPQLQFIHLCGGEDEESLRRHYEGIGARAHVTAFCDDTVGVVRMATAVMSRAGASSLAEYAAASLPALLVPYPSAVDDHQWHNARLFGESGAAEFVAESALLEADTTDCLSRILFDPETRRSMQVGLGQWAKLNAAQRIARDVMKMVRGKVSPETGGVSTTPSDPATETGREADPNNQTLVTQ